jgi:hypothetical protein
VLSCCCRSSKRWPRKNNKNEKAKKGIFHTAEELFGHGEKSFHTFITIKMKSRSVFFGLRAFLANMFTGLIDG